MSYSFKDEELTSEKSLWDVYKLTHRILPSKIHIFVMLVTMTALGLNAFIFVDNESNLLRDVRKWSELGFNFSITTLGFLIAGFTIFATLSKPKMMLAMMDHTNKATGLPTLKYNFLTFMKVFIAYIMTCMLYLLVTILGQADGFISNVITQIPDSTCIKTSAIKVAYIIIGSSFVYLLLLLKSFIFNIYTTVMNSLRWEYHQE